jgi:uncharacterized repeat protein (TIGR01451 family)
MMAVIVLAAAVASGALIGAPAYAASTADLVVTLSNKVDAAAGKRVTYTVVVTNKGPSRATGVQIDFTTSAALSSVRYAIANGHCYRSPREVPCHWYRSVKRGASVTVSISGVMPKAMAKGTPVTNTVTVHSNTKRINRANDRATDNYRLGISRVTAPVVAPSPSTSSAGKLAQITKTAAKVADYTSHVALWTFIILGTAAMWFVIGLAMHHRRRAAEADFDVNDDGDD